MGEVTMIGLDLAKHVFQVHGVDAEGATVLRKQLRRAQVLAFFSRLPRCMVGMEACGTAHYWARELRGLGREVRLMPAQYVKAYVKRNKNDAADAAAICEAVVRPTMRFVAVKTVEQNGGVWDGALLGARVACAWPRGAADAGAIREGLCEAQQERRGGCCGDLRGGCAADDAVCGGEDGRAAGRCAAAPWPRAAGSPAHGAGECIA